MIISIPLTPQNPAPQTALAKEAPFASAALNLWRNRLADDIILPEQFFGPHVGLSTQRPGSTDACGPRRCPSVFARAVNNKGTAGPSSCARSSRVVFQRGCTLGVLFSIYLRCARIGTQGCPRSTPAGAPSSRGRTIPKNTSRCSPISPTDPPNLIPESSLARRFFSAS